MTDPLDDSRNPNHGRSGGLLPCQPTAEPVRRCKHDVSEDCPACAEETIAGLKARVEELEAHLAEWAKLGTIEASKASARQASRIEELEAALRFYADPFAWKKQHDPGDDIRVPDFYRETSFGDTAIAALAPSTPAVLR